MTDAQWQAVHDAICAAQDGGADEAYAAWLAVLDAIAEPSEAMLHRVFPNPRDRLAARDNLRAMIAALRKEVR